MSTLFERLKTDLPSGWCSEQKAEMLAAAVLALRPSISVEIGVWFGRSLSAMALAHKELGNGMVVAIDPWQREASVEGLQEIENREWWGSVDHDAVHRHFLDSVHKLGIQNVVKVIREKSCNVEPPDNIGLLHCDGSHGPQAIRDAERFAPHVKVGGLWVCDDVEWSGKFVEKSLDVLSSLGFIELYRVKDKENTWAVHQRIRAVHQRIK